jgi:hypothetical protein
MKNWAFYNLLREPRVEVFADGHQEPAAPGEGHAKWTVEKVAAATGCGRCHLNRVLRNYPGMGGLTRRKLVGFFKREFPMRWRAILESLGWDDAGKIKRKTSKVLRSTFHKEQLNAECGERSAEWGNGNDAKYGTNGTKG